MQYLHTMLRVADLDSALAFYCEGLGLVETRRMDHEGGRFTLVFLAAPDDVERAKSDKAPLIELTYNWPEEDGTFETYTGGRNFGHLAYAVDDIYATCAHLQAQGITILRPPRNGHMAFIRSPDGASVELLQKGERRAPQEPWASMENTGEW
jgi:lactoylglutathione lyase